MKTKKLIILSTCLISGLLFGKEYHAQILNENELESTSSFQSQVLFQEGQDYIVKTPSTTQSTITKEKVIHFNDFNLEKAIKLDLNLTDDQHITTTNILDLWYLKSIGTGITDLSGLEYATNLQKITLSNNHIKSLKPLEHLSKLFSIGLSNNPDLTTSDLSVLTNFDLLELDLSDNSNMKDFSKLKAFKNIERLWLNNCNLDNADFLENTLSLTHLYLDNNSLEQINIPILQYLYTLSVNNNKLKTLSNTAQVHNIFAKSNEITSLDNLNAPELRILGLEDNQIHSIKMTSAPKLAQLFLRYNKLETLDGIQAAPNLYDLNLSYNALKNINGIENLSRLESLSLQDNLDIENFTPLSYAQNLTQILANNTDMSLNKIKQFGNLSKLKILALSNFTSQGSSSNLITSLDFLDQFKSLNGLSIDGHALSTISKLKELGISVYSAKNQMVQLPKVNLNQSTSLNILDKEGQLPAVIKFNTPGEITMNNESLIHSLTWNQIGLNSLTFESSDHLFTGIVKQTVIN